MVSQFPLEEPSASGAVIGCGCWGAVLWVSGGRCGVSAAPPPGVLCWCPVAAAEMLLPICRSYEDCCGTRCCVRALSIQRLWYFWLLLMMAVLFCCGAGFIIRRRMYPSALRDEPAFNVSFTRHPVNSPGTCNTSYLFIYFFGRDSAC
uniref:WW domain binding protein VOPP1 n=1 Tax=Neogobius melanostomus TaxID=47308 RepID=A0A8C6WTQ7_9GOBI